MGPRSVFRQAMKRLECIVEGCNAVIEAETEEEVMEQAAEHAGSNHPEVEMDDETQEAIRSSIMTI